MPIIELTDRFCQTAKAGDNRKADFFDTTVKGLCLRASAGGTRAFFLVYSKQDGSRAWLKLGAYPEMTLAKARQKARDARASIGEGMDPAADKRAAAASLTVSDLVESYITRRAVDAKRGDEIERRLRHDVLPLIGGVKLANLHRRDLTRCIDAMMDRGARAGANRLFDDLRAMVRWAKARGDLDNNLVDGMRRPAETVQRDRVLSEDEIRTVWRELPAAAMQEQTRRILRLCLVSAQRVGEVCGMTRDEVDFEQAVWTIPAARSKNGREHSVPLSSMAAQILSEQIADLDAEASRLGRDVSDFVFPSPGGRAAMTNASISKAVSRQETAGPDGKLTLGVAPWTPHDLRRTGATFMEESLISPFVVGHILNHVSVTKATVTSRVYARYSYDKEKREALDLWAARLQAIINGGAEVVAIGSKRNR
jgi:integrase